MAVLALNDNTYLNNITLHKTDFDWLNQSYADLLLCMPHGLHLLAISPADKSIQDKLVNKFHDFEQHYIACPAHGEELGYRSQAGDVLLVLDGTATVKQKAD